MSVFTATLSSWWLCSCERAAARLSPRTPHAVAELEERAVLLLCVLHEPICHALGSRGLARADVAVKDGERVLVGDEVDQGERAIVVLFVPRLELVLLEEQAHLRLNAQVPVLESEKRLLARRQGRFGKGNFEFKKLRVAHWMKSLRSMAQPLLM
jgi:hypothetical protein